MKKQYNKPLIFIEDFSVSQYIAGSCADKAPAGSDGSTVTHTYHASNCWIDLDGTGTTKIFNNITCNIGADNLHDEDKNCYHGPIDVNLFFGS